ncbi:bifunctional RNase H/acid phosphatase, partial [Streptomyces sp. NPDC059378]|uniref:bifunctional RNase H/acid phosphatase n=1 Tax=Streptomyces sp. NPDC059378 TaxID=3346815 RepID=UPI0036ABC973
GARVADVGTGTGAGAVAGGSAAATGAAVATPAVPGAPADGPGVPASATGAPASAADAPGAATGAAEDESATTPSVTSAVPAATPVAVPPVGTSGASAGGSGVQDRAVKAAADVRAARAVRDVPAPGWAPADMGAPATFVLLRHGETPLTPQKRFSGSGGTDPSLSAAGREQAERVAAALLRRGTIQAIVASPLARTRETAAVVAARLGLDVTIDDGLRETDFGAWEGLTFGEVRERHPQDLDAWLADPEAAPSGGGESFAATAVRIAATRDRLVAAHAGRTVLLVSHVTPIKTLLRLALGAPPESLFRMELSAASLSAVAYYADGNASVRLFNDTSHLR